MHQWRKEQRQTCEFPSLPLFPLTHHCLLLPIASETFQIPRVASDIGFHEWCVQGLISLIARNSLLDNATT